jgi:hypothetical protein
LCSEVPRHLVVLVHIQLLGLGVFNLECAASSVDIGSI